jgi:hypothetical protein
MILEAKVFEATVNLPPHIIHKARREAVLVEIVPGYLTIVILRLVP